LKITVNVHEAKTHLFQLLDRVKSGDEGVLAKNGVPFGGLVPLETPKKRQLGFIKGTVSRAFFEPLSEEELSAWEK
jgi:prevent-host-death family protein